MSTPQFRTHTDGLTTKAERLVSAARDALNIPASRAALRRGLGRPPEHPMVRGAHAVVAPVLGERFDRATERAFYSVAALIAAQPPQARADANGDASTEDDAVPPTLRDTEQPPAGEVAGVRRRGNLGSALAYAVNKNLMNETTTEARLHLLCRQDLDGLHRQLPRLIGQLRSEIVPVDWVALVIDLSRWQSDANRVAKTWLQSYHRDRRYTDATTTDSAPESEDQ